METKIKMRSNANPRTNRARIPQLDILRGIAIILVMGNHLPVRPYNLNGTLRTWLDLWVRCGWIGVDLFFVLSGFLVSGLLFEEYKNFGRINLTRFYIRRGFKIFPAFYSMILISPFLIPLVSDSRPAWNDYLAEILYFHNYMPSIFLFWGHTWSLPVEAHFYLVIGLLAFFQIRKGGALPFRNIPKLFLILAILCLGMRIIMRNNFIFANQTHMFPTHLRVDSLFFGVLLGYYHHFYAGSMRNYVLRWSPAIMIVAVLGIIPSMVWDKGQNFFLDAWGPSLLYLSFGGILATCLYHPSFHEHQENQLSRSLIFMGIYSYSIFIWNYPIKLLVEAFTNKYYYLPFGWQLLIYGSASVGAGYLSAKLIEFPFLRIRNVYRPTSTRSA